LADLGNTEYFIPYYAVFRPGQEPTHFQGMFRTPEEFLDRAGLSGEAVDKTTVAGEAGGSNDVMEQLAEGGALR